MDAPQWQDIDNSNTEQFISDPTFTAVLVCRV